MRPTNEWDNYAMAPERPTAGSEDGATARDGQAQPGRWDPPSQWYGPTITRRRASGAVLAAVLVLVVGIVVARAVLFPGLGIVDRINDSHSPLLMEATYEPSLFGWGSVHVYLTPGATKAEAHEFWCDIVIPAAGDRLDKEDVTVWSSYPPEAGYSSVLAYSRDVCTP